MSNYATSLADRAAVLLAPALSELVAKAYSNRVGVDVGQMQYLIALSTNVAKQLQAEAEKVAS